uniref:Protein krueppel n=1 Tax=Anopheles epiroticus TaxID=199890 RepID=A0A182PRX8_9DIPT
MKCCVSGCDTDDNVVSYTSVFYVNCPNDPVTQQQWFTLLQVSDADGMRALLEGKAKVCSCHFAEESFAQHPVYGYRYLLPFSLPTIFPPQKEIIETKPVGIEQEKDPALDCFLVYLDNSAEPALLDHAAVAEMTHGTQINLNENSALLEPNQEEKVVVEDENATSIEEPSDVADGDPGDGVDDEDYDAIEQIGIEYANGKYYFLRLDDDITPDIDPNREGSENVPLQETSKNTIPKAQQNRSIHETDGLVIEPDDNEYDDFQGMDISDSENDRLDIKQVYPESREMVDGEEILSMGDSDGTAESAEYKAVSLKAEYLMGSEPENEQNDKKFVPGTMSEVDYGLIEVLDDQSVCDDKVQVTEKNNGKDHFFCEFCGRGFRYKSLLERHHLVHTKVKKFSCAVCKRGFTQKVNLDIHMRQHTGESAPKKYTCQICDKQCIRLSELKGHMTAHLRKFPHVCPLCTSRYSDATGFYDHFVGEHRHEMTLGELVELLSQNQNTIIVSEKEEPPNILRDDGKYECTVCGKAYRQESYLERHKRKMHVKIFNCPHCPRKFLYKSLLTKHLPTHTLEKPYQCPHCLLSYTQRVNLRVHLERKHPEHHPVEQSAAAENNGGIDESVDLLKSNDGELLIEKSKTTDGRKRTYDCRLCGKRFARSSSLMQHVEAHKREPNPVTYDCEDCVISLSTRVALEKHRWRLHGEHRNNMNMISNLGLRNVTIVRTDDDQYVEIDFSDTVSEDLDNEF